MYRITTATGESFLTEKANYIRVNRKNGVYVLTDAARAEGVVYHETPYLFKDGAMCCEVDGGELTQGSAELLNTLLTGEV